MLDLDTIEDYAEPPDISTRRKQHGRIGADAGCK